MVQNLSAYPFSLPFLREDFELAFDPAITIIVGENGTGKSTLLEAIAGHGRLRRSGGGKGYMPVDHSRAIESTAALWRGAAGRLAAEGHQRLVLPRRELLLGRALSRRGGPRAGAAAARFLSHSHGEGFLRFFEERCQRQGIFIFDEPETALSPARQVEFLKILRRMDEAHTAR